MKVLVLELAKIFKKVLYKERPNDIIIFNKILLQNQYTLNLFKQTRVMMLKNVIVGKGG